MPDPALGSAAAGQRVLVEEPIAAQRNAADGAVVQRTLHDIGIGGLAGHQQHAMRPEHQADRGAGLGVGGLVRQIVVACEALVGPGRPETTGDIEALLRQVVPQPDAGVVQALIGVLGREVRHRRIQIHRPHCMPHHLVLLAHRDMRLVVFVDAVIPGSRIAAARPRLDVEIMRLAAALVDEIARQIHVPRLAGEAGQLDQRQLDLLVTAIAAKLALPATEAARDQVGIAAHHIEQPPLARGGGIGDRAFHQMAGAVQLVPVAQVAEPRLGRAALEVAVEVAVRLLRRLDARDDVVDHRLQFLVALCRRACTRQPRSTCRCRSPSTSPAWPAWCRSTSPHGRSAADRPAHGHRARRRCRPSRIAGAGTESWHRAPRSGAAPRTRRRRQPR